MFDVVVELLDFTKLRSNLEAVYNSYIQWELIFHLSVYFLEQSKQKSYNGSIVTV